MKLIINTASLYSGGGVQVAFSFIEECKRFQSNEYHVFLCDALRLQIKTENYSSNFKFYNVERKSNTMKQIFSLKKELSQLESQIKPDCVFTVFGPSYWTPKSPHLLGYAIPHFLYKESPFWFKLSFRAKVRFFVDEFLKKYFFKRNSHYYHVETNDTQERLSSFLQIPLDNIFTVSNTYSSWFDLSAETCFELQKILPKKDNKKRFLILSAFYLHKNLDILNQLIPILIKNELDNVEFVTTLPETIFLNKFTSVARSMIKNIGIIPSKSCPQLYSECDFVFLPTLLECFSANYPEAMKMDKPILTSDLSFARSICGDAALYFEPLEPRAIAQKIELLLSDKELQDNLILEGRKQLKNFPSAQERAEMYLNICKTISNAN